MDFSKLPKWALPTGAVVVALALYFIIRSGAKKQAVATPPPVEAENGGTQSGTVFIPTGSGGGSSTTSTTNVDSHETTEANTYTYSPPNASSVVYNDHNNNVPVSGIPIPGTTPITVAPPTPTVLQGVQTSSAGATAGTDPSDPLSVSLTAPISGAVGRALELVTQVQGTPGAIGQAWIKDPAGNWSPLGQYSSNEAYQSTYVPTMAGTYEIVAYGEDPGVPDVLTPENKWDWQKMTSPLFINVA